jgi:hemolysin III
MISTADKTGSATPLRINERSQSLGEEIANTVSHGLGFVAAVVGALFLLMTAMQRGNSSFTVGAGIFAGTMMLLYLASTLFHMPVMRQTKPTLLVCDHAVIYLFIAGTCTPFALGVLHGLWGWVLLGLVWVMAAAGVAFKIIVGAVRYPKISTSMYLAMGWVFVIAAAPLWQRMPPAGLVWLVAGGLAYTVGVGFFLANKMRYHHLIWHLFVLAGTACHFVAVLNYAYAS